MVKSTNLSPDSEEGAIECSKVPYLQGENGQERQNRRRIATLEMQGMQSNLDQQDR